MIHNDYTLKFAREKKEHPHHWIVVPNIRSGKNELAYIGPERRKKELDKDRVG